MNIVLPNDYVAYLESDGTDEGNTAGAPGYFMLWHPDEIEEMNEKLDVARLAPGFLGFGSDGGGELLAFDKNGAVFMLPMVGLDTKYAKKIAGSWSEIQERIEK